MLQRDAFKLKASTGRNDQTSSFSFFEKLLKIVLHPHPPISILRGLFLLQDFRDCPTRPAHGGCRSWRSRGRSASSGPSRALLGAALLRAGPAADGGAPSLPSCSSFSITLSFSSADPPRHGPRKRTAIPRGRKQSLPCVCRSSSWQRVGGKKWKWG